MHEQVFNAEQSTEAAAPGSITEQDATSRILPVIPPVLSRKVLPSRGMVRRMGTKWASVRWSGAEEVNV